MAKPKMQGGSLFKPKKQTTYPPLHGISTSDRLQLLLDHQSKKNINRNLPGERKAWQVVVDACSDVPHGLQMAVSTNHVNASNGIKITTNSFKMLTIKQSMVKKLSTNA